MEPIKIIGIVTKEVGHPRNDGTRGSGLYKVPLRLSREPSAAWGQLFVRTWDRPPSFSTMHRPGIASVSGDRIILDGTTVEEVERYHANTLRLVVEKVNAEITVAEERANAMLEEKEAERVRHLNSVGEVAERIRFDG